MTGIDLMSAFPALVGLVGGGVFRGSRALPPGHAARARADAGANRIRRYPRRVGKRNERACGQRVPLPLAVVPIEA